MTTCAAPTGSKVETRSLCCSVSVMARGKTQFLACARCRLTARSRRRRRICCPIALGRACFPIVQTRALSGIPGNAELIWTDWAKLGRWAFCKPPSPTDFVLPRSAPHGAKASGYCSASRRARRKIIAPLSSKSPSTSATPTASNPTLPARTFHGRLSCRLTVASGSMPVLKFCRLTYRVLHSELVLLIAV